MNAQKIGVIGGGLMGHGIAYLLAAAGHAIGVFEPTPEIRATLPKRLRAIADLFGDDPGCLKTYRRTINSRPRLRVQVSFSKQRQRNCP
jgi:glycine/D-amino acid oxidase-like deaminating enzyme